MLCGAWGDSKTAGLSQSSKIVTKIKCLGVPNLGLQIPEDGVRTVKFNIGFNIIAIVIKTRK